MMTQSRVENLFVCRFITKLGYLQRRIRKKTTSIYFEKKNIPVLFPTVKENI